jgi:DNA-binding MarR family transcriptional regulator
VPGSDSDSPDFYDGSDYDITASVGYQIARLMLQMRREVESRMAEHGLTDAQWKPLWLLKSGRASTAIELARETGADAGAVTRMLDRLEAKGLIERVRSAADRRVVLLRLTAAGDAAVAAVPHVLAAVNNDFLRGFSNQEWRQLRELIGRMAGNGAAMQTPESVA